MDRVCSSGKGFKPLAQAAWWCSKGQSETLFQINSDSAIYSLGYNECQWYFKCFGGFIGDPLTLSFLSVSSSLAIFFRDFIGMINSVIVLVSGMLIIKNIQM